MIVSEMPLVSIVVFVYNSGKFVIETLESIKQQTYHNIELIISDDCSTDNTIEICNQWIGENKHRFVRAELLTVKQNTGIPANHNRGYSITNGEWIKGIAGDDILLPHCIETYVNYVCKNPHSVIVFGKEQLFDSDNRNHLIDIYPHDCDLYFFDLPSQQQFLALLERCLIPAPTNFIKSSFVKNNPFDERFRLMEDYPYWLKMTHQGIKLDFINEVTVLYRWGESVSKTKVNLHPKAGCENSRQFYWLEKRNLLKLYRPELIDKERKQLLEYELADLFFKNRRTLISRIIMRLLRYFINLFHYDVM